MLRGIRWGVRKHSAQGAKARRQIAAGGAAFVALRAMAVLLPAPEKACAAAFYDPTSNKAGTGRMIFDVNEGHAGRAAVKTKWRKLPERWIPCVTHVPLELTVS